MPTYVYECQRCQHRFEVLQSITDPPRKRCPKCRGAVRRVVMPGGGLIFHGSGFYITDYKRKEDAAKTAAQRGGSREDPGEKAKSSDSGSGEGSGKGSGKGSGEGSGKPSGERSGKQSARGGGKDSGPGGGKASGEGRASRSGA